MLWAAMLILFGIGTPNPGQLQDSTLVLRPPAAVCRDSGCPTFLGPAWIPTNPLPGYPPLLRDAGIQHVADVVAHVDSTGQVVGVTDRDTLVTRTPRYFQRPLADYVQAWRFVPATSAGRPVASTVRVIMIWTSRSCGERGSDGTLTATVRVGVAALVAEIAACTPPILFGVP